MRDPIPGLTDAENEAALAALCHWTCDADSFREFALGFAAGLACARQAAPGGIALQAQTDADQLVGGLVCLGTGCAGLTRTDGPCAHVAADCTCRRSDLRIDLRPR